MEESHSLPVQPIEPRTPTIFVGFLFAHLVPFADKVPNSSLNVRLKFVDRSCARMRAAHALDIQEAHLLQRRARQSFFCENAERDPEC